jgi:hypothetical protein
MTAGAAFPFRPASDQSGNAPFAAAWATKGQFVGMGEARVVRQSLGKTPVRGHSNGPHRMPEVTRSRELRPSMYIAGRILDIAGGELV